LINSRVHQLINPFIMYCLI